MYIGLHTVLLWFTLHYFSDYVIAVGRRVLKILYNTWVCLRCNDGGTIVGLLTLHVSVSVSWEGFAVVSSVLKMQYEPPADFTPAELGLKLEMRFDMLECYIQRIFNAVDGLEVWSQKLG